MPQFAYPFDPHADNDANIVKAEQHVLSQDMPSYRVILPSFAPFFETNDLIITCNDKPLLNGFDYYLSHRYFRGVERTGKLMYGGIWIINPKLSGTFKVSYRTLGGKFTPARSVLDDYLTNRLSDPSTASWEEVINDDPFFPPVDIQFDRDAFKDEADVQTSIREVASVIENKDQTESDIYRMMDDWFKQLKKIVDDSSLTNHQLDMNNPHEELWHESDALKESGISQNSAKVFNKTINDLATYVNDRGITQTDLDQYVERSGGNEVTGDIVLKDGVMSLSFTKDNTTTRWANINLSNGNVSFTAISDGIVHADKDKNSPGKRAVLESGNVELSVTSRGAAKTDDDLLINDKVVVHDGNLEDHIPTTGTYVIDIETKDSDDLSFSGKGITGNPLKADVTLHDASPSTYGVAVGSVDINDTSLAKVAFSEASYLIDSDVKQKVPNTVTVNSVPLSTDVVLNAGHFGLENVANMPDVEMPVVTEHYTILSSKAQLDHTHSFDELGIDRATSSVYGVTYIHDDPSSTATDRGFSSSKLFDLDSEVYSLEYKANNSLPDDVIDISQYGGNHWLPVPVQGKYGAAGINTSMYSMMALKEIDGKVILLRNGKDMIESGVYYWYFTMLANGGISDVISTTTVYKPNFLPEDAVVVGIRLGNKDCFIAEVDELGTRSAYLIFTGGTMDGKYHTGGKINFDIRGRRPIMHGDKVYFVNNYCGNAGAYVELAYINKTDILAEGVADPTPIKLNGTALYGVIRTDVERFQYCDIAESRDLTSQAMYHLDDNNYYTTRNWRHSSQNSTISQDGKMIRVYHVNTIYFWGPVGGEWFDRWDTSYTVDMETGEVTIDRPEQFPLTMTRVNATTHGVIDYNGSKCGGDRQSWTGSRANNYSTTVELDDLNYIAIRYYGAESTPTVYVDQIDDDGRSHYENAKCGYRHNVNKGGNIFEGALGSPVGGNVKGLIVLPNDYIAGMNNDGSKFIARVDKQGSYMGDGSGWGPHSHRVTIDSTTLTHLKQCPVIKHDGKTYMSGFILASDRTSAYSDVQVSVEGEVTYSEQVTFAAHSDFSNKLYEIAAATKPEFETGHTGRRWELYHYKLEDGRVLTFVRMLAMFWNDEHTTRALHWQLHRVNLTMVGNVITDVELVETYNDALVAGSGVTSIASSNYSFPPSWLAKTSDGKWAVYGMTSGGYNSGGRGFRAVLDKNLVHEVSNSIYGSYHKASGYYYDDTLGFFVMNRHASGHAIYAYTCGDTSDDYLTLSTKATTYILSSRVAEGWQIYFTQEVQFFIGSTAHVIPETTIDLQTLYPSTHKTNKFYIYASVEGGAAHYELNEQYVTDSSTAIYIGVCETDETQITNLQVNRATRLGDFREFNEHLTDSKPHGLDLSQVTTDDVGLGLLENKSIRNTLVIPTFKEVFDGWYRLSHQGTKPYPAIPAETTTWTYNEATDAIRNTTNSAGLVGMISPDDVMAGDYDFITGVSSTSADDDWIGVIFAMVVKDGIEHTLSALCTGTDTRTQEFEVRYNHGQGATRGERTLFSHTTELKFGWDSIGERIITVKRRGDTFEVHVTKMMTDSATEQTFSFDVKDDPVLAELFRGAVRFGYCAQSQPNSTWRNILRPDEDGKNFYASQKLYRDNFSWSNRIKTVSGSITHTSTVGAELYFDIPIPTDLQGFNLQAWGSLAYSRDSSGGIASASLVGERTGNIVRFKHPTPGYGFTSPKIDYNITFFTDVRMI